MIQSKLPSGICRRRDLLAGLAASALIPANAQASAASESAVSELQQFLAGTFGRPPAVRLARARQVLAAANPLSDRGLLAEIAAMAVVVRAIPTRQAVTEGLPTSSKTAIERAIKHHGGEAWTHALAGAWHYQVLAKSRLGAMLYGASKSAGDTHFARAAQLSSDPGTALAEAIAILSDGDAGPDATRVLGRLEASRAMRSGSADYQSLVRQSSDEIIELLRIRNFRGAAQRVSALF